MGSWSIGHWVLVLVVVVLVFGTRKLGNVGTDLGKAIKGFKDGMKGGEEEKTASQPANDPATIDVQAKDKSQS